MKISFPPARLVALVVALIAPAALLGEDSKSGTASSPTPSPTPSTTPVTPIVETPPPKMPPIIGND